MSQPSASSNVAALGIEQTAVGLKIPRVILKVVRIVELDRVDENAGNEDLVLGPRPFEKGSMPLVQGTHSRHKAYAFATGSLRGNRLAEFFFCSTD